MKSVRRADQIDIELFMGDPWPKPREDLALQALAEIQALDAAPSAQRFRDDWLDGRQLPATEVMTWSGGTAADSALAVLAGGMADHYGWSDDHARAFILADCAPHLALFETGVLRHPPGEPGNPAASTFTNKVVLVVRPQATKQEVADAYDQLRRVLLVQEGVEVGERNRATSSPRTRDLAVLGYRIWRGDFETWHSAFVAYETDHPEDAAAYRSRTSGKVGVKTFRRDVYNAYLRVTGCPLTWQPGLRREEVKDHEQTE